ncbi:MAG: DUF2752 domain-containing protein [Planctomycetes bacterium]|nr:DUF2752 domain-containing protein [Planctomycetota bacterium]
MLTASTLVIVLSFLLAVRSDQRVEFRFLRGRALPDTCLTRTVLHIPCPGCGLTRSYIFLAQGDWNASWQMHKLGWLLALATLFQIPYRSYILLTGHTAPIGVVWPKRFGNLILVLLIVHGVIRAVFHFWS